MDRETWLKELTAERAEIDVALDEARLNNLRVRRDQIAAAIAALEPLVADAAALRTHPTPGAVVPPERRPRTRRGPRRRAAAPTKGVGPLPDRIAAVLRTRALPLHEIAKRLPSVSVNTVSARLAQLTAAGRIVKNGHRPAVYALP